MIEALYRQYFHDVFLYLKAVTKSDDIAEELTQETFFKAMKSLDSFKGGCEVRVWLCQIAKNCWYSYCRKQKHIAGELPEDLPDTAPPPTLAFEDKETVLAIHRIVHTLPEPYKEVFTLRVFGELPFKDIAGLFGKTENWAAVTFHRAKLKIIDQMEGSK